MVTRYGFSENIGTINYEEEADDVFLGYDLGHANRHSEFISGEIDREVRRIVEECYAKAKELIGQNIEVLHRSAALLMEKEKISGEEFEALFGPAADAPAETAAASEETVPAETAAASEETVPAEDAGSEEA